MARAILVVDVQKVYTDPASPLHCVGNADAIANINAIVSAGHAADDLVVHVRHVHRTDGSDAGRMFDFSGEPGKLGFVAGTEEVEDDPRLKVPASALTISKQRYFCFAGTGLEQMLRERSIDRIVVTGFMTNFCQDRGPKRVSPVSGENIRKQPFRSRHYLGRTDGRMRSRTDVETEAKQKALPPEVDVRACCHARYP